MEWAGKDAVHSRRLLPLSKHRIRNSVVGAILQAFNDTFAAELLIFCGRNVLKDERYNRNMTYFSKLNSFGSLLHGTLCACGTRGLIFNLQAEEKMK
jgi:hypothetical protein